MLSNKPEYWCNKATEQLRAGNPEMAYIAYLFCFQACDWWRDMTEVDKGLFMLRFGRTLYEDLLPAGKKNVNEGD